MSIWRMRSRGIGRSAVAPRADDFDESVFGVADASTGAASDWVFFGSYACHVDHSVVVPEGEAGLVFMRDFIKRNRRTKAQGEADFVSGFVGFLSYDLGKRWVGGQRCGNAVNSRGGRARVPDAHFVFVDKVTCLSDEKEMSSFLPGQELQNSSTNRQAHPEFFPLITREEYFDKIARIKEYLFAGETYQVNFSQRFEVPFGGEALELFQRLSHINPSPFQFFMETPEFAVISNSPERLFKISSSVAGAERIIATRPIKGTAPRGKTPKEDEENVRWLLASQKDAAELAMIVDLERNDIGKLCKPGTVEVNENRAIEKYSHVIHTVANVRGVLEEKYDWYDALKALFPGGSVTGCPKKRTMEIIQELENEQRGVYCGSAGWIDLSGDCDFNIMIRTLWLKKEKIGLLRGSPNGTLTFRSGGGIVVDSDPQKEYEETLYKAEAIKNAIYEYSG